MLNPSGSAEGSDMAPDGFSQGSGGCAVRGVCHNRFSERPVESSVIRHGAGAADGWFGPVVELVSIPVHHRALCQAFKTVHPLVAGSTVESRRQC